MNVDKLKFDISVAYDCDEGEGCREYLENGTYEEAVELFNDLDSRTWIDRYYHHMYVSLGVYGEDGNKLDLAKILDGEYSWISDCSSSSKTEASEMPAACLEFLEDLRDGDEKRKAKRIKALKKRIKKLEKELETCKAALAKLEACSKDGDGSI